MFLSVREMELRRVRFDATYPPGEIELGDIRQAAPMHVDGSAELVGSTQEIRVRGKLDVTVEADCDRCLETATFPISTTFDLFYRPDASDGEERELDEGEVQVGFYEGGGLELKDILREQVELALPMQRVCSDVCKGICPVCGENRNLECGCEIKPVDNRWAALKDLKI